MSDAEDVLDRFSGMISIEHASKIASGRSTKENKSDSDPGGAKVSDTTEILSFIESAKKSKNDGLKDSNYVVDLEDEIYRVFNPKGFNGVQSNQNRRVIVMGKAGNTIKLNLFDKLSEVLDSKPYERGEKVLVKNAAIDVALGELHALRNTSLSSVSASNGGITDFSAINEGDRNIDVIGRIVEISQMRYTTGLRGEKVAFSSCVLTDSNNSRIEAYLLGYCALVAEKIRLHSPVKLEFCSARSLNGHITINAGDLSRLVQIKPLDRRLQRR
jgi:hypothetical protein